MKVHHEVTALHPERKTVSVKNLTTGEVFEESYDKLILSPGAKPTQPKLPGIDMEKVFTLRTVEDTFRLKKYIETKKPTSAVLAGGGFIGLELAENLKGSWHRCNNRSAPKAVNESIRCRYGIIYS